MGSLGLANSVEPMIKAVAGGNRAKNAYIEAVVRGATAKVSPILRKASDMSGGFIASCRNPIRASFVRKNAALGEISQALALGEAIVSAEKKSSSAVVECFCKQTSGAIIATGKLVSSSLKCSNEAFDIGIIEIANSVKKKVRPNFL